MDATAIITVLIVIVSLVVSGLMSTVYYEPLDEDEERVPPRAGRRNPGRDTGY